MGDVSSSLFALGYHEKIDACGNIPIFIAELRKALFARVYAADKGLAVFLGRPPRIIKAYCTFQIPANIPGLWETESEAASRVTDSSTLNEADSLRDSSEGEEINYMADTRCMARFAALKEEVLELLRNRHSQDQLERIKLLIPFRFGDNCQLIFPTATLNKPLSTSGRTCLLISN